MSRNSPFATDVVCELNGGDDRQMSSPSVFEQREEHFIEEWPCAWPLKEFIGDVDSIWVVGVEMGGKSLHV